MKERKLVVGVIVLAFIFSFAGSLWAEETNMININTASEEELAQLIRVGPKTAEKIVKYREQHGAFQKPEDIMLVQGVGKKTWELNKLPSSGASRVFFMKMILSLIFPGVFELFSTESYGFPEKR